MKTIRNISVILLAFFITTVYGQDLKESEVPQVVKDNFRKKYPEVSAHDWEWKKKKAVYEAEFHQNGIKYETYLNSKGEWLLTERSIKKDEIPQAVWTSLAKTEYAQWDKDDFEEHQTPKEPLLYKIEVEQGKQEKVLYFSPEGELVKAVLKKEDRFS